MSEDKTDTPRRFIAGAVCPKCAQMDKIVMYRKGGKDFRECVECGFKDEMRFQPVQRELTTRVNTTEQQRESETQVVQLIPLADSEKHKQ